MLFQLVFFILMGLNHGEKIREARKEGYYEAISDIPIQALMYVPVKPKASNTTKI